MRPTQILFQFEHDHRNAVIAAEYAKLQAKLAKRAERKRQKEARRVAGIMRKAAAEKRRAEEEIRKSQNRRKRDQARRERTPDEHAQCGIRWYCRSPRERERGCFWTHCHDCGKPLIYTSDPNAKPQECAGRKR